MKIILTIECECGNSDSMELKRFTEEREGKVYEDYSSVTESEFKNKLFIAKQSQPDEVVIMCSNCAKRHDLST